MPGKFNPPFLPPPSNFPQSDLGCRADSRWALPQISSFIINDIHMKQIQKMQKMCQYSIYQINHNSAFLQIPVYIFKIFIININQWIVYTLKSLCQVWSGKIWNDKNAECHQYKTCTISSMRICSVESIPNGQSACKQCCSGYRKQENQVSQQCQLESEKRLKVLPSENIPQKVCFLRYVFWCFSPSALTTLQQQLFVPNNAK